MSGRPWSSDDRQRFADGDRLRAKSVPGKKPLPPEVEEWLDAEPAVPPPDALTMLPPEDGETIFLSVTIDVIGSGQARAREAFEHGERIDSLVTEIEELVGRLAGYVPVTGSTISVGFPAE